MSVKLTEGELREVLGYDPASGLFTWLVGRGGVKRGAIAGCIDPSTGYVRIYVNKKNMHAHRLAWLYMTGAFPDRQIDHISGIRSDNRWENLREASQSQNNANRKGLHPRNTSGYKGVSWSSKKGCWWAQIKIDGVHHNLGYYDDPCQAAEAYKSAALKAFGDYYAG